MSRFAFASTGKASRLLVISELSIVYLGFLLVSVGFYFNSYDILSNQLQMLIEVLVIPLVIIVLMLSLGLYNPRLRCNGDGVGRRLVIICSLVLLLALSLSGLNALSSSFHVVSLSVLTSLCMLMGFRYFISHKFGDTFRRKVLVIGAGKRAEIIRQRMRREADKKGFTIVGFVPMAGDDEIDTGELKMAVDLDQPNLLVQMVKDQRIDEIVVACDERRGHLPLQALFACKLYGVEVMDVLNFIERETGQIAVNQLYPSWLVYSNGFVRSDSIRSIASNMLNLGLAVIIICLLWPLLLFVMMAIYLEDRGPIFYRQTRIGYAGKPFEILKFRSMRVNAQANGAQWAAKNDSRATRIGQFMRKYHIDELPQIFNILKGEMSFIGPRPEQPEFVERLCTQLPYYAERHNVKPGLAGWAQLKYPYGACDKDALEKLQYDLYYVKHRNFWFDLAIFVQTIEVVCFAQGSR
ncbi:TIGR03013 family PEP-CTERM/XrtA system glycosyltransferase [Motilimonas cestriensis]|uniref:TIGR03013 family PEP-CTERM/XrtA system glycosyltransferase n=1 Tax=Motilimonas cestriensis TaxID=2742685 RepID=A0ABS8W5E6_9GAMM|nr:TIGR03013 family XrtA/PEP-CTERM system glycosyltransferase [Motilimonas cestriensis]MCE2594194.1 TIGR03013 family PEP-CTERM/XrtA system glycosyltransferase [Motilimonas cestriensis]